MATRKPNKQSSAAKKPTAKKPTVRKTSRKKKAKSPTSQKTSIKKVSPKKKPEKPSNKVVAKKNFAAELLYGIDESYQLVNQRTRTVERVIDRDEMDAEFQRRHTEMDQQFRQADKALKQVSRWIKDGYFGENVSCTVAFRKKFGRVISPLRFVIEVQVPFKVSKENLVPWPNGGPKKGAKAAGLYVVPDVVDDVLTKVVETRFYRTDAANLTSSAVPKSGLVRLKSDKSLADISANPAINLSDTEVIGGLPTVESNEANWGTFGIAYRDASGTKSFGLVNAHFADAIMVQPPWKPKPADIPKWDVGIVMDNKKFEGHIKGEKPGEKFYVDAALIELNNSRSVVLDLVHGFGNDGFLFANRYLRFSLDATKKVFKFGARTKELIEGYIENPEDTVPFGNTNIGKVIRARRRISGTFTLGGDSGSALVAPIFDATSNRERFLVVGLCFGGLEGDSDVLYACHFAGVIKALELKIPADQLRDKWKYSNQ
jgi:hypothetical protein